MASRMFLLFVAILLMVRINSSRSKAASLALSTWSNISDPNMVITSALLLLAIQVFHPLLSSAFPFSFLKLKYRNDIRVFQTRSSSLINSLSCLFEAEGGCWGRSNCYSAFL
uniref:Uncharacterized protein n=1 Tax=Salix viminalis TaxID=40686 RepID=A0A6N2K881_SALVM